MQEALMLTNKAAVALRYILTSDFFLIYFLTMHQWLLLLNIFEEYLWNMPISRRFFFLASQTEAGVLLPSSSQLYQQSEITLSCPSATKEEIGGISTLSKSAGTIFVWGE